MAMTLESFHPTVAQWFAGELGEPTRTQVEGWPAIQSGAHTLIAAPTGTGKTLAAFLWALDGLLRQGDELPDATQVLYVSPLRALSNDVQKNLAGPLAAIRALDPSLPEVRVLVRTGDTPASARTSMAKRPPHVLVTTPESLYVLLTSASGRAMLATVRTVIVDEIHALARDKRGTHLALSLERLAALCGGQDGQGVDGPQRIGLSATQKPLETVGRLLVGVGRECTLVDAGHLRALDLDVFVPEIPLTAVCSHEQWNEIYERMAALVGEHKTTLVFVNTRKLAERLTARLTEKLGPGRVACHHGSLSKETRLDAEQRLKAGKLSALVATASLELGIDIGDVDLVLQVGSARSIATLLQRVGRAGHGVHRTPKGRLFPLTLDEAVEAVALLRSIRARELDRTPEPRLALDILAQQVVAACVGGEWRENELFACCARAWPFRELAREDFDAVVALHSQGRHALLHRDAVGGRLLATKRARIPALTSGGAIPDNADYRVLLEPSGTLIGTLNEDFAIESNVNDIFQLGNASWRILKIERGVVRVADAEGQPPTLPFWLGEAPSRTRELSEAIGEVRERCGDGGADWIVAETGVGRAVAEQVAEYLAAGAAALGAMPSHRRIVVERFFDESGGMQLVVHSLFGSRINRALGLALRKRVCRGFGFELQAAASEESVVLSLGTQQSFELDSVLDWLRSTTARDVLVQALLDSPMFTTRWRWNVSRALLLPRQQGSRPVPPPIQRMRAEDLLARAFPQALACPETLPGGANMDIEVPWEHPIVRQTIEDCLHEAMDVDGFLELLRGLEDGRIARAAIDTSEPSAFAHGILSAQPYSFLDDAPLEERRTQAVQTRRVLDAKTADELGALDPAAIALVREQAWPRPESAEELHEALTWMGFVTDEEARGGSGSVVVDIGANGEPAVGGSLGGPGWMPWLAELAAAGRAVRVGARWFATEAPKHGKEVLRGRLEALGPVLESDPLIAEFATEVRELEGEGDVLRARFAGERGWCNRRLLARIHRLTLDRLRQSIQPASASEFLSFLARWQHAEPESRLDGPRGVYEAIAQLAGFQAPAAAWERHILPARVAGYRSDWLDLLTLSGEVAWGRLWGGGAAALKSTPIALFPRAELASWLALADEPDLAGAKSDARTVHEALAARGALFYSDLERASGLLPTRVEAGLSELAALGVATSDSFAGLRTLIHPPRIHRRRVVAPPVPAGRWTLLERPRPADSSARNDREHTNDVPTPRELAEFAARVLLRRTGVVFRRTLAREKIPVPWRDILRVFRTLEDRGEIRGGRFVAGFSGEQYALPEAVSALRAARRADRTERTEPRPPLTVAAADPLNLVGILTPDERVASNSGRKVALAV